MNLNIFKITGLARRFLNAARVSIKPAEPMMTEQELERQMFREDNVQLFIDLLGEGKLEEAERLYLRLYQEDCERGYHASFSEASRVWEARAGAIRAYRLNLTERDKERLGRQFAEAAKDLKLSAPEGFDMRAVLSAREAAIQRYREALARDLEEWRQNVTPEIARRVAEEQVFDVEGNTLPFWRLQDVLKIKSDMPDPESGPMFAA